MTRAHVLLLRVVCVTVVAHPGAAPAQSLRGSPASLEQQNRQARRHDFTYLRESAQVHRFVDAGLLVRVLNREDYVLKDVSFPFARPEVKLFVERLSGQYRSACGEPLVVTSLTRPKSHQPRNASPDSVHPTGMALDLRRPRNSACRRWLEDTLLYLEARMILDATMERGPPALPCRGLSTRLRGLCRRSDRTASLRGPNRRSRERHLPGASPRYAVAHLAPVRHHTVRLAPCEPARVFAHSPGPDPHHPDVDQLVLSGPPRRDDGVRRVAPDRLPDAAEDVSRHVWVSSENVRNGSVTGPAVPSLDLSLGSAASSLGLAAKTARPDRRPCLLVATTSHDLGRFSPLRPRLGTSGHNRREERPRCDLRRL